MQSCTVRGSEDLRYAGDTQATQLVCTWKLLSSKFFWVLNMKATTHTVQVDTVFKRISSSFQAESVILTDISFFGSWVEHLRHATLITS